MITALYTYRGGGSSRTYSLNIKTSKHFSKRKERTKKRIEERKINKNKIRSPAKKTDGIWIIQPREMSRQDIVASLYEYEMAVSLIGFCCFCLYIDNPGLRKYARMRIGRKKFKTTKIDETEGIIYVQPENAFEAKEVSRALETFKRRLEEELKTLPFDLSLYV